MISGSQVRQKYIEFFKGHGHAPVPSAPLVPENDPSTLFTGSGMQPMIPYLLGASHPLGVRIVDSQKCFRSQDIEEVGDNRHDTFFEMLGNWSLGDYFKKEQLGWLFQFLTEELSLPREKLWVSVFEGNKDIPKDEEAAGIWRSLGIATDHIFYYGVKKNWWSRSGVPDAMPLGEPGGPDSEVFFDFGTELHLHENSEFSSEECHPNCDCGRFMEIGNSVFMTYKKTEHGFVPLEKKNIDFGGGLERMAAACNNDPDIFKTDLFQSIISEVEKSSAQKYSSDANKPSIRIIADHLKASTFLMIDGVIPSNKAQGYYLRRLLRRAAVKMYQLKGTLTPVPDFKKICASVLDTYQDTPYVNFARDSEIINSIIEEELSKFSSSLDKGLRELNKLQIGELNALNAFNLFQTYGFPFEVTEELYLQKGARLDRKEFDDIFASHRELSRTASKGMFKGGLEDQSEITTKYHTATHLLHKALREVLGTHVQQKGSNITSERLRFDFSHPAKVTEEQLQTVEKIINQKIEDNLPVTRQEIPKTQALAEGALAFFVEKYPEVVSVYTIGDLQNWYSKELCGGPHVKATGQIGHISVIKEESAGSGIRRIYAKLDNPV
jgi:alanyl-tRNA synthetase